MGVGVPVKMLTALATGKKKLLSVVRDNWDVRRSYAVVDDIHCRRSSQSRLITSYRGWTATMVSAGVVTFILADIKEFKAG